MRTVYDDTCMLHNTDNEMTMEVDVLDFFLSKKLVVSIEKSVKLNLLYDEYHNIYVGSMAGMEFTSEGPIEYSKNKGYQR